MADTFNFGSGKYAAKITRAGTDAKLTQTIIAGADFANYSRLKGRKLGVLVLGKTAIASHLRIVVDDGVTQTASTYHTGGNTAEALTALHTLSTSATKLEVRVEVNSSNGDAYVGGFQFVLSDVAPSDWQYRNNIPVATGTLAGILSAAAQVIGGVKSFLSNPLYYPGSQSTQTAQINGTVYADSSPHVSTTTSAESLAQTPSLPANLLDANGKGLRIRVWGTFAATASAKNPRLQFGTSPGSFTIIELNGSGATFNAKTWSMEATITRISPTAATARAQAVLGGSAVDVTAPVVVGGYYEAMRGTFAAPAVDFAQSTLIARLSTIDAAIGNTTVLGFVVEMI